MSTATLGALLYAFFEHFLKAQKKGVSAATIKSYRDGERLFLLFVAMVFSQGRSGVVWSRPL